MTEKGYQLLKRNVQKYFYHKFIWQLLKATVWLTYLYSGSAQDRNRNKSPMDPVKARPINLQDNLNITIIQNKPYETI